MGDEQFIALCAQRTGQQELRIQINRKPRSSRINPIVGFNKDLALQGASNNGIPKSILGTAING